MEIPTLPQGRYFEDFETGQRLRTRARTVTEADIAVFAGLSGDYNSIHTDEPYAQGTTFGHRVAHGLLGLAIVSGLAVRSGILEGTVLAFREISDWKFSLPVYIGDTIHAELTVDELKPLPRLGGGSVGLTFDVRNQSDQTVMRGRWVVLVQSRPAA